MWSKTFIYAEGSWIFITVNKQDLFFIVVPLFEGLLFSHFLCLCLYTVWSFWWYWWGDCFVLDLKIILVLCRTVSAEMRTSDELFFYVFRWAGQACAVSSQTLHLGVYWKWKQILEFRIVLSLVSCISYWKQESWWRKMSSDCLLWRHPHLFSNIWGTHPILKSFWPICVNAIFMAMHGGN